MTLSRKRVDVRTAQRKRSQSNSAGWSTSFSTANAFTFSDPRLHTDHAPNGCSPHGFVEINFSKYHVLDRLFDRSMKNIPGSPDAHADSQMRFQRYFALIVLYTFPPHWRSQSASAFTASMNRSVMHTERFAFVTNPMVRFT